MIIFTTIYQLFLLPYIYSYCLGCSIFFKGEAHQKSIVQQNNSSDKKQYLSLRQKQVKQSMQPQKQSGQSQKPKVNFTYQNSNVNQIPVQQIKPPAQQKMPIPIQKINVVSKSINNYYPQQQVYQQQSYQEYEPNEQILDCGPMGFYEAPPEGPHIQLLNKKQQDKDKKVVAVIVSFVAMSTYDNLFTSVQQKSQEGTKVLVYSCTSHSFDIIFKQFQGQDTKNQEAKELVNHIKELDPDCVVFNWECSSGYMSQNFPEGKDRLFDFIKFVIDRGHMVMFSDFSLKSLINQWDSTKLGPNPFKKIGETSAAIQLSFEKEKLIDCPSAQLQVVGQMSQKGKCHVEVMGGTIVYSVDKRIKKNNFYTMEILTVAETDCPCDDENYILEALGRKGTAGHILLTYSSGGHLLTSMGHWIQLMKIDTSEHKLFQIAERQYGAQYANEMKSQYAQMDFQQQRQFVSYNAVNFVQNSAPCQNMASKTIYQKKM